VKQDLAKVFVARPDAQRIEKGRYEKRTFPAPLIKADLPTPLALTTAIVTFTTLPPACALACPASAPYLCVIAAVVLVLAEETIVVALLSTEVRRTSPASKSREMSGRLLDAREAGLGGGDGGRGRPS
jgi:hypothetical protein